MATYHPRRCLSRGNVFEDRSSSQSRTGTLRNKKGTEIVKTILTMITTWQQRGLDTSSMMKASI